MAVANTAGAIRMSRVPISMKQSTLYRIPTVSLVLTSLVAGMADILHLPPLYSETMRLGGCPDSC